MNPSTVSEVSSVKHEDSFPMDKIMTHDEIMSHCSTQEHREIASLYFTLIKVRAMNAARRAIGTKHG